MGWECRYPPELWGTQDVPAIGLKPSPQDWDYSPAMFILRTEALHNAQEDGIIDAERKERAARAMLHLVEEDRG